MICSWAITVLRIQACAGYNSDPTGVLTNRLSMDDDECLENCNHETLLQKCKKLTEDYKGLQEVNKTVVKGLQEVTTIAERERREGVDNVSIQVLSVVRKVKSNISARAPDLQITMETPEESEARSYAKPKSTTIESCLHRGQSLQVFPLVAFS
jgi:uncharacterized membrane protein